MSPRRVLTTAGRVLRQVRHDHRTIGLVFFLPTILISVLYFVFEANHVLFNAVAPLLLGIIPFTLMFIITSVAMLRERTAGTLERLLTTPTTKTEIILGYAAAFGCLALIQASIASAFTLNLLDVSIRGSALSLVGVAVLSGFCGMAFGLLFSAFARNEFQAVQFMPAFVLPQFLTCGLFTARENMAGFLQFFSDFMPITYVVKALQEVKSYPVWTDALTVNCLAVGGFVVLAFVLGTLSLRSK